MSNKDVKFQEDYKYGFKDKDVSILKTFFYKKTLYISKGI